MDFWFPPQIVYLLLWQIFIANSSWCTLFTNLYCISSIPIDFENNFIRQDMYTLLTQFPRLVMTLRTTVLVWPSVPRLWSMTQTCFEQCPTQTTVWLLETSVCCSARVSDYMGQPDFCLNCTEDTYPGHFSSRLCLSCLLSLPPISLVPPLTFFFFNVFIFPFSPFSSSLLSSHPSRGSVWTWLQLSTSLSRKLLFKGGTVHPLWWGMSHR